MVWSGSGPASKGLLVTSKETIKCSRMGTSEAGIQGIWSQTIYAFSHASLPNIGSCKTNIPLHQLQLDAYRNESFKIYPAFTGFLDAPDGQTNHNIKQTRNKYGVSLSVSLGMGLSCGNLLTNT